MRLELENSSFLELEVTNSGTAGIAYDCALRATLESDICGGNREFYVDGEDVSIFLKDLASISATLSGTAIIKSESPGDFSLKIEPVDRLGHFALTVSIGRQFYIGNKTFMALAANSFSLESQALETICKKLITFFKENGNA